MGSMSAEVGNVINLEAWKAAHRMTAPADVLDDGFELGSPVTPVALTDLAYNRLSEVTLVNALHRARIACRIRTVARPVLETLTPDSLANVFGRSLDMYLGGGGEGSMYFPEPSPFSLDVGARLGGLALDPVQMAKVKGIQDRVHASAVAVVDGIARRARILTEEEILDGYDLRKWLNPPVVRGLLHVVDLLA